MDESYHIQHQMNLQHQMQQHLQHQQHKHQHQQQQQQFSYYSNPPSTQNTPSQYVNSFYSNPSTQPQMSLNQLLQSPRTTPSTNPVLVGQSHTQTPNQQQQILPSPSTTGYSTPQQYYSYSAQPHFDTSYLYKNLLAVQSNRNYLNYTLPTSNQIDTSNQQSSLSNMTSTSNKLPHHHLYLYSTNNSFLNLSNNINTESVSIYSNYQNQDMLQQNVDPNQNAHMPNTNPYLSYNHHHMHYMHYNHPIYNNQHYQQYQYHMPTNNSNITTTIPSTNTNNKSNTQLQSVQQQQKAVLTPVKTKTEAQNLNGTDTTNKKNLIPNLQIPKYVKPKMVKTLGSSSNNSISTKSNTKSQLQIETISNSITYLPNQTSPKLVPQIETQLPSLSESQSAPKPISVNSLQVNNLSPLPPSPSPIGSSLNGDSNIINNSPVQYNSLNLTKDDYETSYNTSSLINNITNIINTDHDKNVLTSISNNNNNNNSNNYHAMLISPNLRTLYDKKKPPPPYPGKLNNEIKMDIDSPNDNLYTNSTRTGTSSNSSIQSNQTQSVIRYCSPQAYKFFMEQHAENILKHHKAREYRRLQLENEMNKLELIPSLKEQMRKLLRQKETNYLRLRRAKMNKNLFEHIKMLGVGAFGEVNLVRKRDDMQRLYAMKILHKSDVFNRNQAAHVKAERDILAEADNEWVVKLYYSFQDEENLYFVMDYVPGGDLMNLLIKFQIFSEELSRFYIGELTCAIESVHNLGFIHRDIKPDNILIDKYGHIKLTDFGLCTGFHWTHNSKYYKTDEPYNRLLEVTLSSSNNITVNGNNDKRLMAHSLVGTPNYIAPEILSRKGYTKSCDWWSVGVILYEMLVGEPPFRDDTPAGTQMKVINWKKTLKIPDNCDLSMSARDLIFRLCTDSEQRLGSDGIKSHKFFENFDFGPSLRKSKAPYIPQIKHPTDTSNFEPIDDHVLTERKARIEEMHRNYNQMKQQQQNQKNHNKTIKILDLNDSNLFKSTKTNHRIEPYEISSRLNDSYSNNNPMLYEFAFRRFFDEAYTADSNFNRLNEVDSNNLSTTNTTNTTTTTTTTTTMTSTQDDKESDDNLNNLISPLSQSFTSMMASVKTSSTPPLPILMTKKSSSSSCSMSSSSISIDKDINNNNNLIVM